MSDQTIINTRNIMALAEADKLNKARIHELEATVKGLQATAATNAQVVQELRQQVMVLVATRGRGPTT